MANLLTLNKLPNTRVFVAVENGSVECVYLSANRFSMAGENGIQIPFPFFVFRFRMTLKNRYEFRFSFSHHFEKRI